jgi:hypothetical protein
VPTISMFYGILILMYFYDNKKHSVPHIHAEYGEYEATIAIEDGSVLGGSLPSAKMKLVQAWIEIHREDLMRIGSWLFLASQSLKLIHCGRGGHGENSKSHSSR